LQYLGFIAEHCPARVPFCRHKAMVVKFVESDNVNSGKCFIPETEEWIDPPKGLIDALGL
jgi:hypothetical protein